MASLELTPTDEIKQIYATASQGHSSGFTIHTNGESMSVLSDSHHSLDHTPANCNISKPNQPSNSNNWHIYYKRTNHSSRMPYLSTSVDQAWKTTWGI
ncbi:hypothetical protein PSTG_00772 [Puccinia striiformis f. sp. tritici PST-78]|uniref:Uncharacterized protein n=1 Tax=Puccinia striiformis f. sp. tritici PST-78 TaxID=1165861 RepID=A0A0L0W4P3_9BASI|nr:hypothetical protein PSTG_00772 [Puccinia striiformis f. sp. tritici PST-78]